MKKKEEDRLGGGVDFLCGSMFGPRGFAAGTVGQIFSKKVLCQPLLWLGGLSFPSGQGEGDGWQWVGQGQDAKPPAVTLE